MAKSNLNLSEMWNSNRDGLKAFQEKYTDMYLWKWFGRDKSRTGLYFLFYLFICLFLVQGQGFKCGLVPSLGENCM